jgi:hypothetical protein
MAKRNAPEVGKKEPIAARVAPDLLAWLEGVAHEQERSLSFMVEKAIRVMREQMESSAKPASRDTKKSAR